MIIMDFEQRTPEWREAKAGKPSSSMFDHLITPGGAATKSTRVDTYSNQLLAEEITGTMAESYTSAAMQRGKELEEEAKETYEFITGNTVRQVGFILHDSKMFGASTDGLVRDDKDPLEIKVVVPHTMVDYYLTGLPAKYKPQIQGELLVTGGERCDFFCYCPGMDPILIHVQRDEAYIKRLHDALVAFDKLLNTKRDALRSRQENQMGWVA